MKRQESRYAYHEIGHAHSGPKKIDKRTSSTESKVRIKAVISNKNASSFNVLEEIIQWQKFDSVKHIALALADQISL